MEPVYRDCQSINQQIFSFIVSNQSIRTVILVARWAYLIEGKIYKDERTDRYRTEHTLLASDLMPEQLGYGENHERGTGSNHSRN